MRQADLVIGAVLVAGAKAPVLVRREDVKEMKDASVLIDVAVDQGGCCGSIFVPRSVASARSPTAAPASAPGAVPYGGRRCKLW